MSGVVGKHVKKSAADYTEYKVTAEAYCGVFKRATVNVRENTQAHRKNRYHKNERMLKYVMQIPEAYSARRKVGGKNRYKRSRDVNDKAELEEFIQLERNCDYIEECREITKLNRQSR